MKKPIDLPGNCSGFQCTLGDNLIRFSEVDDFISSSYLQQYCCPFDIETMSSPRPWCAFVAADTVKQKNKLFTK